MQPKYNWLIQITFNFYSQMTEMAELWQLDKTSKYGRNEEIQQRPNRIRKNQDFLQNQKLQKWSNQKRPKALQVSLNPFLNYGSNNASKPQFCGGPKCTKISSNSFLLGDAYRSSTKMIMPAQMPNLTFCAYSLLCFLYFITLQVFKEDAKIPDTNRQKMHILFT